MFINNFVNKIHFIRTDFSHSAELCGRAQVRAPHGNGWGACTKLTASLTKWTACTQVLISGAAWGPKGRQVHLPARSTRARQMVCPGCQMLVVLLRFLGHIYYNFFTTQFTLFSVQFNECLTNTHISYATTTKIKIRSSPAAAAAAKLLQSCPTLCDPIDGSPPGSPVPGILQARTLEWVAISFSNVWKWKVKVKSFSRVQLLATLWTTAYQAPPSMGFSRQEYWSGVPLPSPMEQSYHPPKFPHDNFQWNTNHPSPWRPLICRWLFQKVTEMESYSTEPEESLT